MNDSGEQQIVPGISISVSGQATVDPILADVLFDLAIKLEEPTNHDGKVSEEGNQPPPIQFPD